MLLRIDNNASLTELGRFTAATEHTDDKRSGEPR